METNTISIQQEYEKLTDFSKGALSKLAEKHGLTLDELLNIVDL